MTATLLHDNIIPVNRLRPIPMQPSFQKWQDELNYWQTEVKFFAQLLGNGMHNCRNFNKTKLSALRHEFLRYQEEILPQLGEELEDVLSAKLQENEQGPGLAKKIERHSQSLKKLKSEVFAHLYDLQALTIR